MSRAILYDGIIGVQSAFHHILETLESGNQYQGFMLGKLLKNPEVTGVLRDYHQERIKKGLQARLISETTYKEEAQKWGYDGVQIRYSTQRLPVGIFLFKNRVMMIAGSENPGACVIEWEELYDDHKTFFEDIWKNALQ